MYARVLIIMYNLRLHNIIPRSRPRLFVNVHVCVLLSLYVVVCCIVAVFVDERFIFMLSSLT